MGKEEYNVRRKIGQPLDEITRDFFDDIDSCKKDGWFTGKVVNNNDPDKEGKCRIRVYGIFGDDIPDKDLPWALPDFNFIGSKLGSFVVPPVDALVKVYFDHGDIYLPHYSTKAVVQSDMPIRSVRNYPHNMVMFETDRGDYLEIDRQTSETTFKHSSGTKITILSNGNIEVFCAGDNLTIESQNTCAITGKNKTTIGGAGGGTFPVLYSTTPGALPTVGADGVTIIGLGASSSVSTGK